MQSQIEAERRAAEVRAPRPTESVLAMKSLFSVKVSQMAIGCGCQHAFMVAGAERHGGARGDAGGGARAGMAGGWGAAAR